MKKILLSLAVLCLFNSAKAGTIISIDASSLTSSASLQVVVFAYDLTTFTPVGQTTPIAVASSSGIINIDEEEVEWDGTAPSGDWGWYSVTVKVKCSTPSTAASIVDCGSLNIDGVTLTPPGDEPASDCFEVATSTCSDGIGTNIHTIAAMGNDGREVRGYPAIITIE